MQGAKFTNILNNPCWNVFTDAVDVEGHLEWHGVFEAFLDVSLNTENMTRFVC